MGLIKNFLISYDELSDVDEGTAPIDIITGGEGDGGIGINPDMTQIIIDEITEALGIDSNKPLGIGRSFFERVKAGEAIHFLKSREREVAQFPFTYVMIALTHKTNVTKKLRTYEDQAEKANVVDGTHNLWNEFDLFTKGLLERLY